MGNVMRHLWGLILGLAFVLLVACGSDSPPATESSETTSSAPGTVTSSSEVDAGPTADGSTGSTNEPSVATDTEPPTAIEPPPSPEAPDETGPPPTAPVSGARLIVVGVEEGDELNFRADPDPAALILDREPTASEVAGREVTATGLSAWHGSQSWWQVVIDDRKAWANAHFLAAPGQSYDLDFPLRGVGAYECPTGSPTWFDAFFERVVETRFVGGYRSMVVGAAVADDAQTTQAWIDVFSVAGEPERGERIHITARHIIDTDEIRVIGAEVIHADGTVLCDAAIHPAGDCDPPDIAEVPYCRASSHFTMSCDAGGGDLDTVVCECITPQPPVGEELTVVGIPLDSSLPVLADPYDETSVLVNHAATAGGLVATGNTESRFWEVRSDGTTGWADSLHLGVLGPTVDLTPPRVTDDSIENLASRLAVTRGADGETVIVVVDVYSEDAVTTRAVVDLLDLPGFDRPGLRLDLTLEPTTEAASFELAAATATSICTEGIDLDGRCRATHP